MVLINLHRNLHEKSSFLSEIMFIRINPYLCHLLTRYQSTIFPNHKSCVRKKGVPFDTLFFSRCCIPDSLSRISVARFEIFVVIPEEFCLYRGVVDHFQLAAIQAVDYFSIFFRQLEIKLYKNKAMNFNLFQSRDSRRFFSRVSVLPELKYIFICRLRDGVVPAVILLSE